MRFWRKIPYGTYQWGVGQQGKAHYCAEKIEIKGTYG